MVRHDSSYDARVFRARARLVLTVGTVLFSAGSASAAPRVLGFAFPGRNNDALATRVERVTEEVARAIGGALVPADDPNRQPIELVAPFERAKSLARRAMFDEAAVAFDELIGRGLRAPQRVDAPAQLISSMVARISIAVARHEPRRAAELLDRLLRFDPAVSLPADEDEPGIHAQLQLLRKKLGPQPTIGADELGAACRAADVLVVARTLDGGRVELTRFDDCRQVARTELVGGDDHAAAAALAPTTLAHGAVELTPANPPAVAHELDSANAVSTPPVDSRSQRSNARAERIAGWATIGVGAGALVLGATFAGLAKATSDDITHPAAGAVWSAGLQDRLHVYEALDTAFFVLGGVAIVAGSVVEIFGHRVTTKPVRVAF
jgi:hypothetical protein